jgi:threonine dehydrogenase-like Zn-dependent dehydrogenase
MNRLAVRSADREAARRAVEAEVSPTNFNMTAIVCRATEGYGCDVYIEATGSPAGVVQGLDIIRKLGRFVEFSVFGAETSVDWSIIGDRKQLDIRGAHLGPFCYPIAIDLLRRGLVTSRGIVTHFYRLEDWDEALRVANSVESVKVLLRPGLAGPVG